MSAEENDKTEETPEEEAVGESGPIPKPNLSALIHMFFMQAMIACGKMISPATNKYETDLNIAKYQVELLELIEEKTKGNLSEDEKTMVDGTLGELRVQFVEIAKAVEKAAADGTLETMGPGGPGGAPGQPPIA